MENQALYGVLCIAEAPNTTETRRAQADALAQHEAATAIYRALRAGGLPYEVWIIAAEFADRYANEATALTALLIAGHEQVFTDSEAA